MIHRVTLFIGLRGSLAADQTARMLHVLLATLAVWMAAGWVATIPFAPMSFPRIFYPLVLEASYVTALVLLRLGHFRRASLAYLAGTWIWATLVCSSTAAYTARERCSTCPCQPRRLGSSDIQPPYGQRVGACSARWYLRLWR